MIALQKFCKKIKSGFSKILLNETKISLKALAQKAHLSAIQEHFLLGNHQFNYLKLDTLVNVVNDNALDINTLIKINNHLKIKFLVAKHVMSLTHNKGQTFVSRASTPLVISSSPLARHK